MLDSDIKTYRRNSEPIVNAYPVLETIYPSAPPLHTSEILLNNCKSKQNNWIYEKSIKNESILRAFLNLNRWPKSLQDNFINSVNNIPLRYFIYDDSGSMSITDGEMVTFNNKVKTCSRWNELCETMTFQYTAANAGQIKSKFLFLNKGLVINSNEQNPYDTLNSMQEMMGGKTPICTCLNKVIEDINTYKNDLIAAGKKVIILIATDGESTDGDIKVPLRILKNLPVHIILRLCTNQESIINFWNDIDQEIELSLDVIDGYCSEAKEIYRVNPSICYSKALHQFREFGTLTIEFDHIDERKLNEDSLDKIVSIIYGNDIPTYLSSTEKNNFITNKKLDKPFCMVHKNKREYVKYPENHLCVIC